MKLKIKYSKELIYLILFTSVISILFILFYEKINKFNILVYFLCLMIGCFSVRYSLIVIILSYTNVFSLLDGIASDFNGSFTDYGLITGVALLISYCINKKFKFSYYDKKKLFIIYLILALFSCGIFVAMIRYNLPLIKGLLPIRSYFILLSCIPLYYYFSSPKNKKLFFDYLTIMLTIVSILFSIQYYQLGKMIFIPIAIATREQTTRILLHTVSPLLILMIGLNLYTIVNEKFSFKRFFFIILSIYVLIFIAQTRIYILSLGVVVLLSLLFFNKRINIKVRICSIIFSFIIGLFILILYGREIFDSMFADVKSYGSDYIRNQAIKYYMGLIKDNYFLFGGGVTNEKYIGSPAYYAVSKRMYLADIGIFGYFFEYGIMGIINIAIIILYILKEIKKSIYSKERHYKYILLSIILITLVTVVPFSNGIILIIILALCNYI